MCLIETCARHTRFVSEIRTNKEDTSEKLLDAIGNDAKEAAEK